ncbi:putative trichohyalin-like isoform 2 [Scophthalmus maximus]|uniref:Putative trichohyalin-like n=1 Tax=Scophthalmus maximus TaxID=52904 RepID=A0A2U9B9C1_SCOMX|nr:putative trichohyalin-like [Scophthalmus maximus]AWP00558.1 putative trichohyalin-like isoform 2 [Scophthalmus maximus]
MAESKDHDETFPGALGEQVIAGPRSPRTTQQASPIPEALTPQEQRWTLFPAVEEGRAQSEVSLYPTFSQEEHDPTAGLEEKQQNYMNSRQLEEKQTQVNMKTNREIITRQRQLTCQVMEEIEEQWERERNEMRHLRTETEQQQKDIERLAAERHDQNLVIKALGVKMENVIKKLEENKNGATQEKLQLLKMQAEIQQERETLDRRRDEIISDRHTLEMIKYDKRGEDSKEHKEPRVIQNQKIIERWISGSLLSAINKNKNIQIEAKQAKEEMEKKIEAIKQEFKITQKYISQHRDHIEHIRHNMSVNINKMKQRWTISHRDAEMQTATVPGKGREGQQEATGTFDSVKEKLSRIQEEMEKVWDVLADSDQQLEFTLREKQELNAQSKEQRQDTDTHMKVTQWETETKAGMQGQKQDIDNTLAQVQCERREIDRINMRILEERKNIERDRHLAKEEMDALKCMRECNERQKRELDDKLQRTKREIREMEVLNTEMEIKKKDLVKMIRMSRRKKEIGKMQNETEHGEQDVEVMTAGQRSEQVLEVDIEDVLEEHKIKLQQEEVMQQKENQCEEDGMEMSTEDNVRADMQRVIFEVQETRKMLHMVREDTVERKRAFTEERKWRNFQERKKRRKQEQWLEKIIIERDELEITKLQIRRQREEAEQNLEHAITTILTMGDMKANMDKAVTEVKIMQEEMRQAQRKMERDKEDVRKYTVS